MQKNSR